MSNDKFKGADLHTKLLRSTSIISCGTLSSRILGFIRDVLLARFMGTGFAADAFFVAQKIPNLLRSFVGEGATDSAVVPVLAEYKFKSEKQAFWEFVNVVLLLALMALSAIVLLGIVLAPVIVRVIAPGFMADPDKLFMTIRLTKIMFPYLLLIGMTAYGTSVLYTFKSFATPAFGPCLFNLAMITGILVSPKFFSEPVYGLGLSVLLGGLLQLLIQIGPMVKLGLPFRWPATLHHPGARKIGRLLIPRMVGAGVYQLTVFIDTFCASLASIVGSGGISAIYYANRIIQFPMGIFGLAIASATLPTLSGFAAREDLEQFKRTLIFSLENIFFIMVPTAVIAVVLATPIIRVLFQRGEFNEYSTMITSSALFFYALGLFSFGGIKILVSAFHALQDTKTPVKVAFVCLAVNAALNFVLMFPMKIAGIALSSSIAATIDFCALLYFIRHKVGRLESGFAPFVAKTFLAAGVTAVAVYAAWNKMALDCEVLKLALAGISGFIIYVISCGLLKVDQAGKIGQWLWGRLRK